MKKLFLILFVIILISIMCSCKRETYTPQEDIVLNYNNIVAGQMHYWIENDAVYYTRQNLLTWPLYRVTESGKETLKLTNVSKVTEYNDKVFFSEDIEDIDDETTVYHLSEYDLSTKESRIIAKINNICNYFVIDDEVFVLTGMFAEDIRDISKISLETGEIASIANDIFAFGVIDNKCCYLIREETVYSLYQYDSETDEEVNLGSFEVFLSANEEMEGYVNFTTDKVVLNVLDRENDKSRIIIYDIKDNSLNELKMSGVVYEMIAFEKFAYLAIYHETGWDDADIMDQILYRINLETLKLEEVDVLDCSDLDLFVTSDNDVYVKVTSSDNNTAEEGLFHYNDTNREKVM